MMFRFRRYRIFVVGAVLIIFLLYRVSMNTGWDGGYASRPNRPFDGPPPSAPGVPSIQDVVEDTFKLPHIPQIPQLKTTLEVKDNYALPTPIPANVDLPPAPATTKPPIVDIPDRLPGKVGDIYEEALQMAPESTTALSTMHWKKMPEYFPVADDDLIPLPTGKPKPVPKIQHKFGQESLDAKAKRELRLNQVKTEMQRAWSGYKTYAFGHDELAPITQTFKDPFCGWAATLVDSLDTLWIMGMKEEFDEAYNALNDIDFTTTPYRSDIPVFETTIRYLGGLLAAYDVTGGHKGDYQLLLNKAVELAEILMGIFDTPNRMPVLYYAWRPVLVSQPHRASASSGIAELGTLSMEFTRLAQLTGKDKYYDAIARITDALYEYQSREGEGAAALPGLFPQNVDASGCNATATAEMRAVAAAQQALTGALSGGQGAAQLPVAWEGTQDKAEPNLEFEAIRGKINDAAENAEAKKLGTPFKNQVPPDNLGGGARSRTSKREVGHINMPNTPNPFPNQIPPHGAAGGTRFRSPNPVADSGLTGRILGENGLPPDWECVPQNLTSGGYGLDSFSMGGSQDSAYEYFPKQFLLLGGLEPKYREMHEKTVEAIKKYLLFRPMIKEDRDILVSGKVNARGKTDENLVYDYELTHLTCFLGGMFGLGGKIFNSEEDVDLGKRLTDGCVWAYDVMPSGIMPEYSTVVPCANSNNCPWNETEWHEALDPGSSWREGQMDDYHLRYADWVVEKQKAIRAHAESLVALDEVKKQAASELTNAAQVEPQAEQLPRETATAKGKVVRSDDDLEYRKPVYKRDSVETSVQVEQVTGEELSTESGRNAGYEKAVDEKVKELEKELGLKGLNDDASNPGSPSYGGLVGEVSIADAEAPQLILPPQPIRPKTHVEYVDERLEKEHLQPGFVTIHDKRYILRPEAIESVWYMYRITGDTIWQEKGWRMFEAVIRNTRNNVGHNAIDDVTHPDGPTATDYMESFWMAETLKYFYLLFTTPDVISLDDWVLNTEAHPFRRPT